MFIVRGKREEHSWISGVFAHHTSVEEYLALIPDEIRSSHSVSQVEGLSYPFYILENQTRFRYLSASGVLDVLTQIECTLSGDEDEVTYMTLYRVNNDWRPQKAGWDYLGALPHHHLDKDLLGKIQREGLHALWGNDS